MRGFRLNGWQRIGIILSVVWLFAGYFLALHLLYDHIYEWHAACLHRPDIPGLPDCESVLNEDLADARSKETGKHGRTKHEASRGAANALYLLVGVKNDIDPRAAADSIRPHSRQCHHNPGGSP